MVLIVNTQGNQAGITPYAIINMYNWGTNGQLGQTANQEFFGYFLLTLATALYHPMFIELVFRNHSDTISQNQTTF